MNKILLTLIGWVLWTSPGLAQNNPIFGGSLSDGYGRGKTETQAHNAIFAGGTEDGFDAVRLAGEQNNKLFVGGIGDGFAYRRIGQVDQNAIFAGGNEDGFSIGRTETQAHNAIFSGGIADGFDWRIIEQKSHNALFRGGPGDGFDYYRTDGIPPTVDPNFPVEFLSFEAWWEAEAVQLQWVTANEVNHDYFEVERSADAQLFVPILQQTGTGGPQAITPYQDVDPVPLVGRSYYRVKAVDYDGTLTYSQIVEVNWQPNQALRLSAYPNPTRDELQVSLRSGLSGTVQLSIFDLAGRQTAVPIQRLSIQGQTQTTLDLASLSEGIYFLRVLFQETGEVVTLKVKKM